MRIVITSMMWRRPEVFIIWANHINRLQSHFPEIDLQVMLAGSEGRRSRNLAEKYGFHYIEVPNEPLGKKANARLQACRDLDPDYVYLCGSDDIISSPTFAKYIEYARRGTDEVVIMNLYYFDALRKQLAFSVGYVDERKGEPIAPFRMISRQMCQKLQWTGWANGERIYLDGHIYSRLERIKHSRVRINLKKHDDFCLDIKTDVNMTPFTWRLNYHKEPMRLLNEHLPPEEVQALMRLADKKKRVRGGRYRGVDYLRGDSQ